MRVLCVQLTLAACFTTLMGRVIREMYLPSFTHAHTHTHTHTHGKHRLSLEKKDEEREH